jgi:hypothetical protein
MPLKYERTQGFVMRHGRRIAVDRITSVAVPSSKPKRAFHAKWVKLPRHWISDLGRCRSANTYRLGMLILLATYEDKRGTGEIVLSTKLTGDMDRATRRRAARELVELGLITLSGGGHYALRARIIQKG